MSGVRIDEREARDLAPARVIARCSYFPDGREGTDRWGTPYKDKQACGTGWESYVCPAYVEESCPGCRNPGNRIEACDVQTCGVACGVCGGGGRSRTVAYCGQEKSTMNTTAFGEMGSSLRLDRYSCDQSAEPVLDFPVNWFPMVEQDRNDSGGKTGQSKGTWMSHLGGYPMFGTTLKTFYESMDSSRRKPLREKLNISTDALLMVNGLVLDDMLDDCWEDRDRILDELVDEVDIMVPPQFSAYTALQNWMALYNANRVLEWHCAAVGRGFRHVALQHPGNQAKWLLNEYVEFAHRSNVKLVAISLQTAHHEKGGYKGGLYDLKWAVENYPSDCRYIVSGPSSHRLIAQVSSAMRAGRKDVKIAFTNVNAYTGSVFFQVYPTARKAPADWSKGRCFSHNVRVFADLTDKVLAAAR